MKGYLTCSQKERVDNFVRFVQQCVDIYDALVCGRHCVNIYLRLLHAALDHLASSVRQEPDLKPTF